MAEVRRGKGSCVSARGVLHLDEFLFNLVTFLSFQCSFCLKKVKVTSELYVIYEKSSVKTICSLYLLYLTQTLLQGCELELKPVGKVRYCCVPKTKGARKTQLSLQLNVPRELVIAHKLRVYHWRE